MDSNSVTIHDVARAAGLSTTTVSAALTGNGRLSDATRELVRREAEKLGYDASPQGRGLRRGRSQEIGLLSPQVDLGVSTLKTHAIARYLNQKGYTVPISAYINDGPGALTVQEKLVASMRRQKLRAVVCDTLNLHGATRALADLRAYLDEGGQAVFYDWPIELEADAVVFDREHNTYLATRHLLENGHRRIGACIPNTTDPRDSRRAGFERAMREFDAPIRTNWVVSVPYALEAEREGATLARWFLELPERPTAMCVVNDMVALAFAATADRHGVRIPEDVSLVGHDNRALAEFGPLPLTTVTHPADEIARRVVELLDSRLTGSYDGPARREVVRGQLVERQSVRKL